MSDELAEQNKMLKSLLAGMAKTIKDFVECPNCGGAGFEITGVKEVFLPDLYGGLGIRFDTEDCACKKQAKGVLAIIRKIEGDEATKAPSEDTE